MSVIRIVIGGRMVGAQRWSVGHTVSTDVSGTTDTVINAYAEACFAAWKTNVWNGSAAGKLAGVCQTVTTCDSARAYLKPSSSAPATQIGVSTGAAVQGLATAGFSPPQICIVATLEDGLAGRHHKGRMYLPTSSQILNANDLLISTAACTAFATSVANYLSAVRTISLGPSAPPVPVVSSITATNPIVAVSVDQVADTQRRRRDKLVGTRQRVSLVVG